MASRGSKHRRSATPRRIDLKKREVAFQKKMMRALNLYTDILEIVAQKIPGTIYARGFPDVLACVKSHMMGIELKAQDNLVTDIQAQSLRFWSYGGAYTCVMTHIVMYSEEGKALLNPKEVVFVCPIIPKGIVGNYDTLVPQENIADLIAQQTPWFHGDHPFRAYQLPVVGGFGPRGQMKMIDISLLINKVCGDDTLLPLKEGEDPNLPMEGADVEE